MKIYVASSWRNELQPMVVKALRAAGHEVYDFRHPAPGDDGFQWSEIDPEWFGWDRETYIKALEHPVAIKGFNNDMKALARADATVCVLPCGRSAHLEAGYAIGQGKPVIFLLTGPLEPELMYKMAYRCVCTIDEIVKALAEIQAGAARVHQCEVCGRLAQWRFVAPAAEVAGPAYQKFACYDHFGPVQESVDAEMASRAMVTEPQIDLCDQGFPIDELPSLIR